MFQARIPEPGFEMRGFSPAFLAASAACYLCGVGPLPFVQGSLLVFVRSDVGL